MKGELTPGRRVYCNADGTFGPLEPGEIVTLADLGLTPEQLKEYRL